MAAPRPPSWDELRTFVEVARDGSLSSAARRLGLLASLRDRHWGLPMMGSGGWGGTIYRTSLP
jgi:hypothetical protein